MRHTPSEPSMKSSVPSTIARRAVTGLVLASAIISIVAVGYAAKSRGATSRGEVPNGVPHALPNGPRVLTLGAYTAPREVYGREIIPAFVKEWKARTGQD